MCFATNAYLGDLHCCCLDPAVPLGTHVVLSWLGACLLPRPQQERKVSGGFEFWRPYLVNHVFAIGLALD